MLDVQSGICSSTIAHGLIDKTREVMPSFLTTGDDNPACPRVEGDSVLSDKLLQGRNALANDTKSIVLSSRGEVLIVIKIGQYSSNI